MTTKLTRRTQLYVLALLAAGAVAPLAAWAQREFTPEIFKSEVRANPGPGQYSIAESVQVNERLRTGKVQYGELAILEPHPTQKRAGAGVAFNIYDDQDRLMVRLAFADVVGRDTLTFGAMGPRSAVLDQSIKSPLSARRGDTVRFRLLVNDANRLSVSIEGRTEHIDLGRRPASLEVEIFCAKAFVRFDEFDAVA